MTEAEGAYLYALYVLPDTSMEYACAKVAYEALNTCEKVALTMVADGGGWPEKFKAQQAKDMNQLYEPKEEVELSIETLVFTTLCERFKIDWRALSKRSAYAQIHGFHALYEED